MPRLLFALFLLLFIQCKDDDTALLSLSYEQTGCADPWATNYDGDDELKTIISDYLITNVSAAFENITFSTDLNFAEACNACSCTTGKIIHIEVEENALSKFTEIGFHEN